MRATQIGWLVTVGLLFATGGPVRADVAALRASGIQMPSSSATPIASGSRGFWLDGSGRLRFDNGTASHFVPEGAFSAKGDLPYFTGSTFGVLPVGTNGQSLIADSTQTGGIKWGIATTTLQQAYNNGSAGAQIITEDLTRLGVIFKNASGGAGTVFGVQAEGGGTWWDVKVNGGGGADSQIGDGYSRLGVNAAPTNAGVAITRSYISSGNSTGSMLKLIGGTAAGAFANTLTPDLWVTSSTIGYTGGAGVPSHSSVYLQPPSIDTGNHSVHMTYASNLTVAGAPSDPSSWIDNLYAIYSTGGINRFEGPLQLGTDNGANTEYIQIGAGQSASVSAGSTGRLIYKTSTNHFYISENGGAYLQVATLGSGGSGTVTGTGTTNTLPLWTDGAGGVLGDSWWSQASSTMSLASGKSLALATGATVAVGSNTLVSSDKLQGGQLASGTVANVALANSSLTVTSGAGLVTGGSVSLGSSVTLDVGAGTGITVNANDVAVDQSFSPTWSGNHAFTNSITLTNGTALSSVADGASAIGFKLNTSNTYSTSGALLLSVQSNGSEKFKVDRNGATTTQGNLTVNGSASINDGAGFTVTTFGDGHSAGLSASSFGTLIYNSSVQHFQMSENGGAYAALVFATRTLTGGTGINTIGDLSADRTISINQGFSPTWTGTHNFDASTAFQILPASNNNATSGTTTVNSAPIKFLGRYWDGSASQTRSFRLEHDITATTPAGKLAFLWGVAGSEAEIAHLASTGALDMGAGQTSAVSASSHGRLIYDASNQHFYVSENGGAYAQIGTSGGSGTVSSGTTNTLAKYTGSTTVGNSNITDDATSVTVGGTNFYVPKIDRASAASLSIGGTNANAIAVGNGTITTTVTGTFAQTSSGTTMNSFALGGTSDVVTVQNTNASGFSVVRFLDNSGTYEGGVGYANASAGAYAGHLVVNAITGKTIDLGINNTAVLSVIAGKVGINTTPLVSLDISGSLRVTSTNTPASGSGVEVGWDGTQGYFLPYNRTGSAYLATDIADAIYIASGSATNRKVSIGGSISPSYQLDVIGGVAGDHVMKVRSTSSTGYSSIVYSDSANTAQATMGWANGSAGGITSKFFLDVASGQTFQISQAGGTAIAAFNATNITFSYGLTTSGNPAFNWAGSGAFTTSTGTNTLSGAVSVASAKSITSAGGAADLDWNASTGKVRLGAASATLGFFGLATPVAQQATGTTLVNSVTTGGTIGTVDDVVAAAVDTTAADLTTTRNAMYQLAKKVRALELALKNYGEIKD